jgi:hypothetical protein
MARAVISFAVTVTVTVTVAVPFSVMVRAARGSFMSTSLSRS